MQAADRSAGNPIETLPNSANPYFDQNASFTVARFKQDVLKNSFLGVTIADRDQKGSFNRLAGVDGRFSIRDRYTVSFQAVQSQSRDQDLSGAIAALSPAQQADLDPSLYERVGDRREGTAWTFSTSRDTRPLNTGFEVSGRSPSFAADMGFIQRTNLLALSGWVRPHYWSKGGQWFTAIHFPFFYERDYDYGADRLTDETWDQVVEFNLPLNTGFGGEAVKRFIAFGGKEFSDINRGAVWAWCERFRTVRSGVTYVVGDQVVFAEAVRGHDRRVSIWSDLRFSTQFDGSFNLENRHVWREDDTKFADALIPRLRLSYQFTKELALRWITEYQRRRLYDGTGARVSDDHTLTPDLLLSYVLRPGTVVYLGYGSFLVGGDPESLRPARSSVFTKVSYLWQL